jgi:hypothetical protein
MYLLRSVDMDDTLVTLCDCAVWHNSGFGGGGIYQVVYLPSVQSLKRCLC